MSNADIMQRKLKDEFGEEYKIIFLDLEKVIYRDFKNNYDIEISGTRKQSTKKKASIYLWYDKRLIVEKKSKIKDIAEEFYNLSEEFVKQGMNTDEKMWDYVNGKRN